jgi:arylsulfatase A-like enzyme
MKFKGFFTICCLLLLSLTNCVQKGTKPNILLILTDDQTYHSINALGNHEIRTPTLDRLVHEGMTFTNAFNMGGWHGAVCVASRTMMNTGGAIWRAHKNEARLHSWANERKLWSQLMEDAGYETYFSGKWHVKVPPDSIFNHVRHIRPGMPADTPVGYDRPIMGQEDAWSPFDTTQGGFWQGGRHWSEVLADDAEHFLARASQQKRPFFMYLAFSAPHDPRQSPKAYVDQYPPGKIAVPETFQPEYPYLGKIGYDRDLRDERLAPYPRTRYAVQVHRAEYYAIISHMDAQIKRILDALKMSGKEENTYIFFTSDHGLACGNHGLMGKQSLFDHSIRVPFVVVGPSVPPNSKNVREIYLQDIMPTSLELAGIEKPDYVDFESIIDLISDPKAQSHYSAIYGCYTNAQRMIRKNGFKLIAYPKAEVILLFDLVNDPLEQFNLSDSLRYAGLKKDLFNDLLALQQQMADTTDIGAAFPQLLSE